MIPVVRGGVADALGHAVPVGHRDHAVPGEPVVVGRARQADHRRARPPGELDGDRADAAGGPGDNDGVAGLTSTARTMAHAVKPATGIAPATSQGRPAGLAGQVRRLRHRVLRLARPVVHPADHLVARRDCVTPGPSRVDDPGEVAALPGRERGGPALVQRALADLRLARVDARRLDPDKDLAGSRLRHGDLADVQHLTGPYSSNRTAFIVASGCRSGCSVPQAGTPRGCPTTAPTQALALDMPPPLR